MSVKLLQCIFFSGRCQDIEKDDPVNVYPHYRLFPFTSLKVGFVAQSKKGSFRPSRPCIYNCIKHKRDVPNRELWGVPNEIDDALDG